MTPRERADQSLASSFERYLQDKGNGRGGDGGNYRRNAACELERFAEWAAADRGSDDWIGIVSDDVDRCHALKHYTKRAELTIQQLKVTLLVDTKMNAE